MAHEIIIRAARPEDKTARAAILREGIMSHCKEAFLLFLFQELCLQGVILAGAVLFIFVGVSPTGLLIILPIAAVTVFVLVKVQHYILSEKHEQKQRSEVYGWVAEARESTILIDPKAHEHVIIQQEADAKTSAYTKIVGTISLSERQRGNDGAWWLHGLAVAPSYRRKGVGKALVSQAKMEAISRGGFAIEAVTSELESEARSLLHNAGWECLGAYHRRLAGPALTLLLSHHSLALPHA